MKLNLIDKDKSFDDLIQQLKKEDPTVERHEFLDLKFSPLQDTSSIKVLDALEDPDKTYFLKLNDEVFRFDEPDFDVRKEASLTSQTEIAKALKPGVEGGHSDQILSTFLTKVEKMIDASKLPEFDRVEIDKIISAYTTELQNTDGSRQRISLARKNIYNLYLKKIQIQKSIQMMEGEKQEIDKKAQFKANLMFSSFFFMCLTEFCVGYYCIYHVEWLGWDLVEPFTYSIGQGKFVLATWFFCKYLSDTNSTSLNQFLVNRFRYKMYKKRLFEYQRLEHLKLQLAEVDKQIDNEEKSLVY